MDQEERDGSMGFDMLDGISVDLTGDVDDAVLWFTEREVERVYLGYGRIIEAVAHYEPAGAPEGCDLDDDHEPHCHACNDSGEGMTDGSVCRECRPARGSYLGNLVWA